MITLLPDNMHLYTARYVGLPRQDEYQNNEVYMLKIARLRDTRILLKKKDGTGAILYESIGMLKEDWIDLHKIGIIDH